MDVGAGSRQERQLMRQRGAGSRQVDDIDFGFGFSFKTPSTAGRGGRTRSQTPATATRQTIRSSLTPNNVNSQHEAPASTRSIRTRQTLSSPQIHEDGLGPQRKRRRLSDISNITAATPKGFHIAEKPPNVEEVLLDEPEVQLNPANNAAGLMAHRIVPSSPLFSSRNDQEEDMLSNENQDSAMEITKPTTKKRKRKSIGQQSLFKKRKFCTPRSALPTPSETTESARSRSQNLLAHESTSSRREPSPVSSLFAEDEVGVPAVSLARARTDSVVSEAVPALTKPQPQRRKKRKSVVLGPKKRKPSLKRVSAMSTGLEASSDDETSLRLRDDPEADEPNGRPIAPSYERHSSVDSDRGVTQYSNSSRHRTLHDDDDVDESYMPEEASPEPEPDVRKTVKKPATARGRTKSQAQKPSRNRGQKSGTVPILTYRTTNIRALPTITEEQDISGNDSDIDELAALDAPAVTTKSNPNAVDVLAQACREAMDSAIANAKGSSSSTKAEMRDHIEALQSLRSCLDNSWFQMSQVLDQRIQMEARLRKSRREKAELQARWLEIRRRRDVLDLRKDSIRRRHWENESLARKRFAASEAAVRLETALANATEQGASNGTASESANLEFMLRDVVKDVSSVAEDGGGGILDTLKEFNARLESLAANLS